MRKAAHRRHRAFSLAETLSVVAILAFAVAIAGGSTWQTLNALQLRNSAGEFLQVVKNARRFAIDHRCRTRIAFREGLWDPELAGRPTEEQRSYRTFAFVVPGSATGASGRWIALNDSENAPGPLTEWARVESAPRSESLVGRWILCDLDPKPRHVPDVLRITSPLFERFVNDGREQFFRENFHTPETVWMEDGADPHEPANCLSAFPADYVRTPVDNGPLVITDKLPEDERCHDPATGGTIEAAKFWPGVVHFIRGSRASKSAELPALEFQPDGSLACTWAEEIEVRFAYTARPQTSYAVLIESATGRARLLDAEAK